MGMMKDLMEQGWIDPDKYVCDDCVEDNYLKGIISSAAEVNACDYCGRSSNEDIAAPVSAIMVSIAETVFYYFNEPTHAGVPWDGGWVFEPTDTADALYSIQLECNDDLFEDIAQSFMNDAWVASAHGHWASLHDDDALRYSWDNFVEVVKHQTRYYFNLVDASDVTGPQEYSPGRVLPAIARVVNELGLVRVISANVKLYRVRERQADMEWEAGAETMGAPPSDTATAGRMNPAGISYLYLAFDPSTALAEVLQRPPAVTVVAEFSVMEKLVVLDLSEIPDIPSIFDSDNRHEREGLLFLEDFVREIARPVRKDGREHVDYVPSQVVCEYFAQAFHLDEDNEKLTGIVYPSAVRDGGKNIVIFPTDRGFKRDFSTVKYVSAYDLSIANWADLFMELE